MALFLENRNRLILPRWREYKRNFVTNEHSPIISSTSTPIPFNNDPDFLDKENDWKDNNSFSNAIELVNAANSLGLKSRAVDAALLLKKNYSLSSQLDKVVRSVLSEEHLEGSSHLENVELHSFFNYIGLKINKLRSRLSEYPNNPLMWAEMGRLHSILGNSIKAEQSLMISFSLSKGLNRYITRAYSRFYYHVGDIDKAHDVLRKSPFINTDPWIMATEISYSIKRGRFSRNIKKGVELIASNQSSPFEISELASMIGTVEVFNGSYKNAKRYIQTSLLAPNDNSLAQAEWLSRQVNDIKFYSWLDKIDYAYEAKAHEFLYNKKFSDSLREGFNWVIDQPFSKRAIKFSSYVASALVKDITSAIEICKFGLRSNPDSFDIINNLVYSYALQNQLNEARIWLPKLAFLKKEEKHKVFVLANEGLICFREQKIEKGKKCYDQAILIADKLENKDYKQSAELNYVREKYLAKIISKEEAVTAIKNLFSKKNTIAINIELESILQQIVK